MWSQEIIQVHIQNFQWEFLNCCHILWSSHLLQLVARGLCKCSVSFCFGQPWEIFQSILQRDSTHMNFQSKLWNMFLWIVNLNKTQRQLLWFFYQLVTQMASQKNSYLPWFSQSFNTRHITQGPNSLQVVIYTAEQNIYCHTNGSVLGQAQH
jgi:hypothetical protein